MSALLPVFQGVLEQVSSGAAAGQGRQGGKKELLARGRAVPGASSSHAGLSPAPAAGGSAGPPPGRPPLSRQPAMTRRWVLRQYRADPLGNID